MTLGGPPANYSFSPTPPERGSFPLDHEGECKVPMQAYLQCLKKARGSNDDCRALAKEYLRCRMDKELMKKEEFENLGL